MLRRYATVGFAMLGLLVCDWEDPSNEGTLVLDAFDGIAEIIDTLETDAASKRRGAVDRQVPLVADVTQGSHMLPENGSLSGGRFGSAPRRRNPKVISGLRDLPKGFGLGAKSNRSKKV